jgi:hypothetical protein
MLLSRGLAWLLLLSALPVQSVEVPADQQSSGVWYSYVDEVSHKTYFHNPATQETTWTLPEGKGVTVVQSDQDADEDADTKPDDEFANDWSDEGFTNVQHVPDSKEAPEDAAADVAATAVKIDATSAKEVETGENEFIAYMQSPVMHFCCAIVSLFGVTFCLTCCTNFAKILKDDVLPDNLEYLNVDCELSRRTKELKINCDSFHEKALGLPKSVSIKEVADLHVKMKAMVKLMEPESERIKRQWETTQRQHSRVHPDSRRGKKLSEQLQRIQQRQQQYNRDCRLINSEMNKFQGSRLFKEAQIYTEGARKSR